MSAALTESERAAVRDLVYHRFIRFQPGMNLILRSQPSQIGMFKAVEASNSDTQVPVEYLNSIKHIDAPDFIPDLAHEPTILMLLNLSFKGYRFEHYTCSVWNESGWRIANDEAALTGPHPSKAAAYVWSLCVTPPF